MNVFWLHPDPETCARQHIDKHLNCGLEQAVRVLCETAYNNGYHKHWMYEREGSEHSTVKWCGESYKNWEHLFKLANELYDEYQYRQGSDARHFSGEMLKKFDLERVEAGFTLTNKMTRPPQVVADYPVLDESYRKQSSISTDEWAQGFEWPEVVESYRYFYVGEFQNIAKWKIRGRPVWWDVYDNTLEQYLERFYEDGKADKTEV